ncbi:MAG: ABC transporter permease [Dehalococcoidia bacterium]
MASLPEIYLRLILARMRAQLQYRVSFALQLAGSFLLSFTDFLAVLVIFAHLPHLAGWSLPEVAFLYGTSYITFQLTDMTAGQLDSLPVLIQRGEFDMVLIRPLGSLFQVLTSDFQLRRVGAISQGALVLGFALTRLNIHWTLGRVLVELLIPIVGLPIFAGVWIIGASTTFWSVRSMEMVNAFTYGGNQLTQYPLNIYSEWLRRLFIFVIPLAFVNYFPALYVLDKPDPLGAPGFVRFLSPLVALVMVLAARLCWGVGVRHYRSTGS